MYLFVHYMHVCFYLWLQRSVCAPLKGKEKDNFWRELLGVLRPGEPRLNITVPEVDDFDPDTYGREQNMTLQGRVMK